MLTRMAIRTRVSSRFDFFLNSRRHLSRTELPGVGVSIKTTSQKESTRRAFDCFPSEQKQQENLPHRPARGERRGGIPDRRGRCLLSEEALHHTLPPFWERGKAGRGRAPAGGRGRCGKGGVARQGGKKSLPAPLAPRTARARPPEGRAWVKNADKRRKAGRAGEPRPRGQLPCKAAARWLCPGPAWGAASPGRPAGCSLCPRLRPGLEDGRWGGGQNPARSPSRVRPPSGRHRLLRPLSCCWPRLHLPQDFYS